MATPTDHDPVMLVTHDNLQGDGTLTHDNWQGDRTLIQCLDYLFSSGMQSDVTFVVGETKDRISAHQIVLVSRSSVFHAMLSDQQSSSWEITMFNTTKDMFTLFLRYLYTDLIELTIDVATSVLPIAKQYAISHLVDKCEQFIQESIVSQNVYCVAIRQKRAELRFLTSQINDEMTLRTKDTEFNRETLTAEKLLKEKYEREVKEDMLDADQVTGHLSEIVEVMLKADNRNRLGENSYEADESVNILHQKVLQDEVAKVVIDQSALGSFTSVEMASPGDLEEQDENDNTRQLENGRPSCRRFLGTNTDTVEGTSLNRKKRKSEGTKSGLKETINNNADKMVIQPKRKDCQKKKPKLINPYKCTKCDQEFDLEKKYKIHLGKKHGEKVYTCDVCQKSFGRLQGLRVHYRTHTGERPFVCRVCSKGFSDRSGLLRHRVIHTGEKPYACDVCNEAFTQIVTLHKHKLRHTGERPHACKSCGKGFKCKAELSQHLEVHQREKPHRCDICEKRFDLISKLQEHIQAHKEKRLKQCETCGKFFSRVQLKVHLRTHADKGDKSCVDCGKLFKKSSHLLEHRRIHTGEKPFMCYVCGKVFTQSATVHKHLRIHSKAKPNHNLSVLDSKVGLI